jgi:hypothetical protein
MAYCGSAGVYSTCDFHHLATNKKEMSTCAQVEADKCRSSFPPFGSTLTGYRKCMEEIPGKCSQDIVLNESGGISPSGNSSSSTRGWVIALSIVAALLVLLIIIRLIKSLRK